MELTFKSMLINNNIVVHKFGPKPDIAYDQFVTQYINDPVCKTICDMFKNVFSVLETTNNVYPLTLYYALSGHVVKMEVLVAYVRLFSNSFDNISVKNNLKEIYRSFNKFKNAEHATNLIKTLNINYNPRDKTYSYTMRSTNNKKSTTANKKKKIEVTPVEEPTTWDEIDAQE